MKINLANKLTILRLILIPFFLIFILNDHLYARIIAFFIFSIASLTDYYDGKIARELNIETTLGKFLDPLADKLLISSALIIFVQIPEIDVPAWMVVLIIGREFLITGFRTLAAARGRVIPAMKAGKFKTTSQITSILLILIILCVNSYLMSHYGISKLQLLAGEGISSTLSWILKHSPYWLMALTTFFTILSGYIYIDANRDVFSENG